jgi:hypothetical protein
MASSVQLRLINFVAVSLSAVESITHRALKNYSGNASQRPRGVWMVADFDQIRFSFATGAPQTE